MRNETWINGVCVEADIYDFDTGRYDREEYGNVVLSRNISADEWVKFGPQPLDPIGSLATLLAVQGVVSVKDAAAVAGLVPDDLVNEAKGWFAAQFLS